MDDLMSRFLDAFATIEKHLRRMLDANKYTTFNEMVERAVSQDRSVRRLRDQLKTLGVLRNLLVHEYKSEQPLAFPSESTVLRIQVIRDELTKPAKLADLLFIFGFRLLSDNWLQTTEKACKIWKSR